jgi:2,3-bisphosphoglycerate-independent phosphoglycerate mutase
MIWDKGPYDWKLIPPHDILTEKVGNYLPQGSQGQLIMEMMKKSVDFLSSHEVNLKRKARGLRPANSIWIWGEGKRPLLSSFYKKYQLKGSVVSAVDLIKGIGICAELDSIDVVGATGNIHTNFAGKAQAAIDALNSGQDFVYLHIEAPDECGHRHEVENKVKSIELIDSEVIRVVKKALDQSKEAYKIMLLPDHPTPLVLRTHTSEPVPFLIYQSHHQKEEMQQTYDEIGAAATGLYISEGYKLMDYFILGSIQEEKNNE